MKLSVVIPAYNESKRIGATIRSIMSYISKRGKDFEFVFVDDGSTDGTKEEIISALNGFKSYRILSHDKNRGKGAAIKTGMLAASGDWILFTDSDMSTPIEELEKFFPLFDGRFGAVIGSRKMKGANVEVRQGFLRENMGKVFTFLSNLILGTSYSDFTCGFKCFEKEISKKIFSAQKIENWSYDSEILYLVVKYKIPVAEVPVRWKNDPNTKVRLIRDILGSFKGLLEIRLNDIRGIYD
ncbi:MAG: glycosyltransferase family 2 protein [Elusimicrobiota bacterium]